MAPGRKERMAIPAASRLAGRGGAMSSEARLFFISSSCSSGDTSSGSGPASAGECSSSACGLTLTTPFEEEEEEEEEAEKEAWAEEEGSARWTQARVSLLLAAAVAAVTKARAAAASSGAPKGATGRTREHRAVARLHVDREALPGGTIGGPEGEARGAPRRGEGRSDWSRRRVGRGGGVCRERESSEAQGQALARRSSRSGTTAAAPQRRRELKLLLWRGRVRRRRVVDPQAGIRSQQHGVRRRERVPAQLQYPEPGTGGEELAGQGNGGRLEDAYRGRGGRVVG